LSQIDASNPGVPAEEVKAYRDHIEKSLRLAGAEIRYYRNRAREETAFSILQKAAEQALREAEVAPQDIDLLIYCGVGRGFLEPAMAYFVSSALGCSCECFDVLDACMSWVRALYIAYSLLGSGRYRRVLIVNAEFNIYECGYPELLKADAPAKWLYSFPAFTIGEAATATVLAASTAPWKFHFRSIPSQVKLCALPLNGYRDYAPGDVQSLARAGINNFMCLGEELATEGRRQMLRFITEIYPDPRKFDKWFPHAATAEPYRREARKLGLEDRVYNRVFPRYGNVVSASIPVGLLSATQESALKRGDRVILFPISAGMSLALVDFIY